MKTVIKKIDTQWLEMILSGKKKFEVRFSDFDIEEGEVLRLEEWVGEGEERRATGRFIEKKVTYAPKIDLKSWLEKQPDVLEKGFYVIQFD